MREVKAAQPRRKGSAWVMRLLAFSVVVVAVAGAALSAQAQGHHGRGEGGMMMFGGSPEHMGRMVDHLLDGLNATDTQRTQIKQIAATAANDLKTQRDASRDLRAQGLQIFTTPNIDARAAETLRQQMSAQHDQASKRMLQAMLEIANVLTPEQRAKLFERMKQREAAMSERMGRSRDAGAAPPSPAASK
jgi:periplasmic protein CpxP/Spy